MSNHSKKMKFETVPPPDFDENVHVWSMWSDKKICQILTYLDKEMDNDNDNNFIKHEDSL